MHSVIVYAKRTPIGKFNGFFSGVSATALGSFLVKDALQSTGISSDRVDEIIMGCVLTAGLGQAPSRQVGLRGGLNARTMATTLNRVCGSGLKSVMAADQAIRARDARLIFAGGMESMTEAPFLLQGARAGLKYGSQELKDHTQFDGLTDPYEGKAMGCFGDLCARDWNLSRERQDAYAHQSYMRARQAQEQGLFKAEILPVEVVVQKKTNLLDKDEQPFSVDLTRLPSLRSAFSADGTVTAGNASSLSDGAALVVVAEEAYAKDLGLKPMARVLAQASFAHEPQWFTTAPHQAITKVLEKAKLKVEDIDLFEINEAFAVVPLSAMDALKIPESKVNIHGGAISLGHPIGASGCRVLVTLLHALKTQNKRYGLATLCIGGGEASAVVVERL